MRLPAWTGLVRELLAHPSGSPEAEAVRIRLEQGLHAHVRRAGLRAVEALAHLPGFVQQDGPAPPHTRNWQTRDGDRTVLVSVTRAPDFTIVYVNDQVKVPVRLTAAHRRQEAFYARYNAVAARAYAPRPPRLSALDRLVLLVGELEADVYNGGFSQYLSNKGRRRAGSALAALREIGARRTARWLEKALAPRVTEEQLSALDTAFYDAPEDLASLTQRYLQGRQTRR